MKFYYRVLSELANEEQSFENIYRKAFNFKDNVMFEKNENMDINTVTYSECEKMARRIAFSLQKMIPSGLAGRPVGLMMENSCEWAAAFFGILMAGFKPLLLNPAAPAENTERCMKHAGAVFGISEDGRQGMTPVSELLSADGEPEMRFEDEIILCTSGTMGEPKLCAYGGRQITAQLLTAGRIIKKTPEMKEHYDKTGKNLKVLCLLPFCHIYGLVANLLWFSVFGQTFVLLKSLNPDIVTATCRLHEVTHIFAPPLLWSTAEKSILREAARTGQESRLKKGIRLSLALQNICPPLGKRAAKRLFKEVHSRVFGSAVDYCISGGGTISADTLRLINGIGYFLTNGYGMTEIGITSLILSRKPSGRISGGVGRPLPSAEYSLKEDGMLLVRGASCFTAYYKNGERIARDTEEWFETGDIFEKSARGYAFKGRADDMINGANGERISPDEIEELFAVADVKSLCVYSDSCGDRDRIILAAEPHGYRPDIVRRLSEELIKINSSLPPRFCADSILIARSPLPFSLNAKVNRRRVKQMINSGELCCVSAAEAVKKEKEEVMSEAKRELVGDIIECFAEAMGRETSEITESSSFIYDLAGNSMEYYLILDRVEQKTGVKIDGSRALTTPLEFAEYILEEA